MVGYCQSHRDFNPRSREGSDDGTQLSVRYGCYFNPRSREGSDQSHKPRTAILQAFQSALPRGERRSGAIRLNNFFIISIRAPARGATQYQGGANAWIEFQSALPRGERPDISSEIHKAFLISIRAPARGATESANTIAAYNYISIRAPARGATITSNRSVRLIRISIRAPARGATCTFTHILSIRQFQSALPRGERHKYIAGTSHTI